MPVTCGDLAFARPSRLMKSQYARGTQGRRARAVGISHSVVEFHRRNESDPFFFLPGGAFVRARAHGEVANCARTKKRRRHERVARLEQSTHGNRYMHISMNLPHILSCTYNVPIVCNKNTFLFFLKQTFFLYKFYVYIRSSTYVHTRGNTVYFDQGNALGAKALDRGLV